MRVIVGVKHFSQRCNNITRQNSHDDFGLDIKYLGKFNDSFDFYLRLPQFLFAISILSILKFETNVLLAKSGINAKHF